MVFADKISHFFDRKQHFLSFSVKKVTIFTQNYSVGVLKHEKFIDGFSENSRHFQCEHRRGHVFPCFDGVDGLTTHADVFGELLLCHAQNGTLHTNVIFHRLPPF